MDTLSLQLKLTKNEMFLFSMLLHYFIRDPLCSFIFHAYTITFNTVSANLFAGKGKNETTPATTLKKKHNKQRGGHNKGVDVGRYKNKFFYTSNILL